MNDRHTEFFGPDYGRGPYTSSNLDTAAIQIAAAIAQLRMPVERDDDALTAHADFIRTLADHISPISSNYINVGVTADESSGVHLTFRTNTPARTQFRVWLADEYGGELAYYAPQTADWTQGVVLEELNSKRQFVVNTDDTGVACLFLDVQYTASYYVGVARGSYVFYTSQININC